MAESPAASESDEDGKLQPEHDSALKRRVVRQPNRRQLEKDVQVLTEQISAKEAELKSLGRPSIETSPAETEEKEKLLREQKETRESKESTITKRKEYDDNIHQISKVISKMSDALSRIKANLPHKTEKAVDDAIHKLEYQLQTQHFKLRDEKRIVNEITILKRSKKQVQLYLTKRSEIESEIKKKEAMKDQRSIYFKKVSVLKTKEDEIRQKLLQLKGKADEAWTRFREAGPQRDRVKKEIDGLYEMRRSLHADFQAQNRDFRVYLELQRIENERKKEEDRKTQEANYRREWFEYELSREPFEDERQLIECLINYLSKLLPKGEGQVLSDGGSPLSGASPVTSVSSGSSLGRSSSFKDEEGTFTILRKKMDEDDEVFLQAASTKKKKGKRKSWMNKPLKHSRVIFNQFASIDLSAPSTALEVSEVMEKLKDKLQYYEDAATSVKMAHSAIPHDMSSSSSVSSGIVTATDVEDTLDFLDDGQLNSTEDAASAGQVGGGGGGAQSAADKQCNVLLDDKGEETANIPESLGHVDSDPLDPHNAAVTRAPNQKDGEKQEGTDGSDRAADECGSSGSDDGKEAGNVTDDSESTVVANEGENGQGSASDGSSLNKELTGVVSQKQSVDTGNVHDAKFVTHSQHITEPVEEIGDMTDEFLDLCMDTREGHDIDKDSEDSGMVDVPEGESRKAGLVERKNETLTLIVSRRGKEVDHSKSDFLSSQTEYSSDYASNSTGSAVSTPTDAIPLKRELGDAHPLSVKDVCDPDNVFQHTVDVQRITDLNVNNNSSALISQRSLQLSHDALHLSSLPDGNETDTDHISDLQREGPPDFLLSSTRL